MTVPLLAGDGLKAKVIITREYKWTGLVKVIDAAETKLVAPLYLHGAKSISGAQCALYIARSAPGKNLEFGESDTYHQP